jgi:putative membrane protein
MRFEFGASSVPKNGIAAAVTRWLVHSVALALVVLWVPGVGLKVEGTREALPAILGGSAVLGLLNWLVRPLLILVTLPVNILTLGLFTFVVNGLVFWCVAALLPFFVIAGFWTAVWASLCFSVFAFVLNALVGGATLSVRAGRRP